MKKLAIITTHPIQYNAPLFKSLTERGQIAVKVFYTWGKRVLKEKYDPGFGKVVNWDIPLLEGYHYEFLHNISKTPGSDHYKGIQNPTIIEDIISWSPSAILIFGWKFESHLKCLRYFKGKIPILFRGDSTLLDYNPWKISDRIKYLLLSKVYRNVDKVLFVGEANRDYFEKCGIREPKLIHVPHVIDNDRFAKGDATTVRKTLDIKEHEILILFCGKLELKKNPLMLIRAFGRLKYQNAHLLIVGSGSLEKNIRREICNMNSNIIPRIHLMGFQNQSNLPAIYKAADLFVLPSKGPEETWGLSINEAMAASTAVIASDKCGAAYDLIHEGHNGYVFPANSEHRLFLSIEKAIQSKIQLTEMGVNSFNLISQWNFHRVAGAIESII